MKESSRTFAVLEMVTVFFWFLLDGFWLFETKVLTYTFSGLAVVTGGLMFVYIKRERIVVLIACADSSWLVLNILWAIGDLSHIKLALIVAKILFGIGFSICVVAFMLSDHRKEWSKLILNRLRIMKYFE